MRALPFPRSLPLLFALGAFALIGCGGSATDTVAISDELLIVSSASGSNVSTADFRTASGTFGTAPGGTLVTLVDADGGRQIQIKIPAGASGERLVDGDEVTVTYSEDNTLVSGKFWTGADGTVTIQSLDSSGAQLKLRNVRFTPVAGTDNTAVGTFVLNGTIQFTRD